MTLLPALIALTNRKCLVIGGHPGAAAIANKLYSESAQVTILDPGLCATLSEGITHHCRDFDLTDLDGCWLVVAATHSQTDNQAIKTHCDARQLFCYVPEDKSSSTWQLYTCMDPVTPPTSQKANGLVSLVGAGPGHPDLLTVQALKLIQSADAIVYDRLVSDPILALCNHSAHFIYAGKSKANHALPQQTINELLVDLAGRYNNVVRLKGGDPFIFGRGGEEIEMLGDHNVPFQIVPGITAASGCAAFAGIPLTHRDHAQSCVFVTGHLRDGNINVDWQELRDPARTIVVYMGLTGIDVICESLIHHGRAVHTPAALVERGTNPEQRVLCSTLQNLPKVVADNEVMAPTLLIIGGVVSLRDKLQWY